MYKLFSKWRRDVQAAFFNKLEILENYITLPRCCCWTTPHFWWLSAKYPVQQKISSKWSII